MTLPDCTCPPMADCPRHGTDKAAWSQRARGKSSLRKVSDPQKENLELWNIIKRSMLLAQERTNGCISCMNCGAVNPDLIDLDHIDGRGWSPENAQLLCRLCHSRKHGEPMFSGSTG